jgi:hypothetical protein
MLGGVRSLPVGGDVQAASDRILTVKVHPLDPPAGWTEPTWLDLNGQPQQTTLGPWETTLDDWRALHEVVDTEPHLDDFGPLYGELAALGIAKGRPFAPDDRMTRILEQAAWIGNGQLRVQSFADRRPDRAVWPDRQWNDRQNDRPGALRLARPMRGPRPGRGPGPPRPRHDPAAGVVLDRTQGTSASAWRLLDVLGRVAAIAFRALGRWSGEGFGLQAVELGLVDGARIQ